MTYWLESTKRYLQEKKSYVNLNCSLCKTKLLSVANYGFQPEDQVTKEPIINEFKGGIKGTKGG